MTETLKEREQILFDDIKVHNLSVVETLEFISKTVKENKQIHHTVINASKVVGMQVDEALKESVLAADLINADGQSIVWASKILNRPLKERVAGIDLMESLVELAYKENYKIYFLGAKEEVVTKVASLYSSKYSPSIIAGFHHGYFDEKYESSIADDIAKSGANFLFVAMSSPQKEIFLYKYREVLSKVNFVMGVGGSFDVVSGLVKRAPLWMQKSGLEWFFRFLQEPRRMWKRYLVGNVKFMFLVLKHRL